MSHTPLLRNLVRVMQLAQRENLRAQGAVSPRSREQLNASRRHFLKLKACGLTRLSPNNICWVFLFAMLTGLTACGGGTSASSGTTPITTNTQLDANFGNAGVVFTDIAGQSDQALAMATQPDGYLLIGGSSASGRLIPTDMILARYSPDGVLDTSFGSGGLVATDFDAGEDSGTCLLLQPDGNIVQAGTATVAGLGSAGLVRYTASGSLDNSFGVVGKVVANYAGLYTRIRACALQTDGSIVIAGDVDNTIGFMTARFDRDGNLDPTFGDQGWVITDFGFAGDANALTIDANGNIVVVGEIADPNYQNTVAMMRVLSDGTPDPDFGVAGKVMTSFNQLSDNPTGVVVQGDGKIVVVGGAQAANQVGGDIALARFNPDGSPDLTFGHTGTVISDIAGNDDNAYDLALQADGTIVVVGTAVLSGKQKILLQRYRSDGSLDTQFGMAGNYLVDLPGNSATATALVIQSNGNLVVAGYGNPGSTNNDMAMLRVIP